MTAASRLPSPIPDLESLQLLISVGERGSINEAAAAHGITQPAASMRLRSLERTLGLQLLRRSPSGSSLTPAGEATVEWAGAVIDALRALLAGTAALRVGEHSQLRLGASMTVAEYLVPTWLQRFTTAEPTVRVALEMGNTAHVVDLVRRGQVDIGFVEGRLPSGRLRTREIGEDRLALVVGAMHPWARRRRPVTAEELAAAPLIMREPGSGTRDVLVDALNEVGLAARVRMELASTTAIKAAVISGSGPAVLSALAIESEVRSGELLVVACSGLRLERKLRAVWPSGHRPSTPASRLIELARSSRAGRGSLREIERRARAGGSR